MAKGEGKTGVRADAGQPRQKAATAVDAFEEAAPVSTDWDGDTTGGSASLRLQAAIRQACRGRSGEKECRELMGNAGPSGNQH